VWNLEKSKNKLNVRPKHLRDDGVIF
jgi:hypothetical protein